MTMQSNCRTSRPINGNCLRQRVSNRATNKKEHCLDEPLLPASTSTLTTKLLWLHPSRVSNQQRPVVSDQFFLQLQSTRSVYVFCVESDQGLGDCLSDGIYLGRVTTTLDTDTDVDEGEVFFACCEDCFVNFEAQDFGAEEADWGAVYVDETAAFSGVCDGCCGLV